MSDCGVCKGWWPLYCLGVSRILARDENVMLAVKVCVIEQQLTVVSLRPCLVPTEI